MRARRGGDESRGYVDWPSPSYILACTLMGSLPQADAIGMIN